MHYYKLQPTCSRWSEFGADCVEDKRQYQYEGRRVYKSETGVPMHKLAYAIFLIGATTAVILFFLISGIKVAYSLRSRWPLIVYGVVASIGLLCYYFQLRAFIDYLFLNNLI